jgi:hypothetical protein
VSDNLHENNTANENNSSSASGQTGAKTDVNRRRFTAASLAASGVVLTLASRPVLGAGSCVPGGGMTISGWTSGNVSSRVITPVVGLSPGYWKNHNWPSGFPSRTDLFKNVFSLYTGPLTSKVAIDDGKGTTMRYATMIDVLSAQVYNDVFARSIACAYLNALNGKPARPTPSEVKMMAGLTFKPVNTAASWTETEVICFLSQTFDKGVSN